MPALKAPAHFSARSAGPVTLTAMFLLLSGCVTRQLEPDFTAISTAYADNMNWQMLLNLARLDQGHPAYFMAIGEVRVARSQTTSLGGTGTSSHTTAQTVAAAVSKTVTNVLSSSLTPGTTSKTDPTFVFIPLNSEAVAKELLEPIPIEVFNTLYQQGWPVDQLLRVMVERIEVEVVDGGRERRVVLTNSPTRASPESFARFLRTCELIRALQKAGGLSLSVEFPPAPPAADKANPAADGEDNDATPKRAARAGGTGKAGAAKTDDAKKPEAPPPIYRFHSNREILDHTLGTYAGNSQFTADAALENLRMVFLNSTLLVGSRTDPVGGKPNKPKETHAVLILRSYRNVLEAVASEQRAYDELARDPAYLASMPARQQRPVLRTDWSGENRNLRLQPFIKVTYAGRKYVIADPDGPAVDLDTRWNRDIFRLLVHLSSQVTVDITKFQRQVLELSQ